MTLLNDVVDNDYLHRREQALVETGPGAQAMTQYGEVEKEPILFPEKPDEYYALMRFEGGASREEVEAEMGGVEESMYSPSDLLIDVATGGLTSAGRTGFKLMGQGAVKQGGKMVGRNVAQDVGYGALAVALMDQARDAGADPIVEALTGILGPAATTGLLQMSRKGLAQWLKNVSANNRQVYSAILDVAQQNGDSKAARVIRELVDGTPDIEAPAPGMSIKNVSDDAVPVKGEAEPDKPSMLGRLMERFSFKKTEPAAPAKAEPLETPPPLVGTSPKAEEVSATLLRESLHAPSESKAVNINFEHIETADEVKGVIEDVSRHYQPSIDKARRGEVKEEQLKALANDLGMREETLLGRNVGEAYNAEQLMAARWVVAQSGEELVSLAKRIKAGENSDDLNRAEGAH